MTVGGDEAVRSDRYWTEGPVLGEALREELELVRESRTNPGSGIPSAPPMLVDAQMRKR